MNMIRVALVEDHTLTRVGIRTALQQRDQIAVVGEASNALSALELLKITPTDVAIVDVGLPGMDGIELTQRLKNASPLGETPETKVLIMTMQDDEEVVMSAFAAGADSYCMKDISINDLVEAIRVTSQGDSWIDPSVARVVLRQTREFQAQAFSKAESGTIAIKAMDNEYDQVVQAYPLTERELEVLELIVDGCSNAKIAERLYITVGTVKTHVRNILNKLCADDRTQLAVRALRSGLVK